MSNFLLNLFDGLSTHYILTAGDSVEVNPLMQFAIEHLGDWFLVPKTLIGLVTAVLIFIGWEKYKVARVGGSIVIAIYGILVAYHTVLICLFY